MAQSLENKYNSNGSGLGYPNNPAQPIPAGAGPSAAAKLSTMHNEYSFIGDPNALAVSPRFDNTGRPLMERTPQPTELRPGNGPQNDRAAGAGFNIFKANSTYDDFILNQNLGPGFDINRLRDNLL